MSISVTEGRYRFRFAGKTDVGKVRAHNEDAILIPTERAIGAIADGMGGHACGEVASDITVRTIEAFYNRTVEEGASTWPVRVPPKASEQNRMINAIKLANSKIYAESEADPAKRGMGCTVDALYLSGGRVYVGHVGDSRVYRLRDGQLTQMTEDHSLLNDFRRVKEMSGEELGDFAQTHKNVVVRALGLADHVRVDTVVEDYKLGDLYLLCSDGLSDMIEDDQIREIMMSKSQRLDGAAQALVDAANDAGGRDNITALLAQVLDG